MGGYRAGEEAARAPRRFDHFIADSEGFRAREDGGRFLLGVKIGHLDISETALGAKRPSWVAPLLRDI